MLLEVCVDQPISAVNAQRGGADRLEICAGLTVGGLTPGEGLITACREAAPQLPAMVLIRPREGDFVYAREELAAAELDIAMARRLGATGVVFGALTPAAEVDREACQRLLSAAESMETTFHRAIDLCDDGDRALDTLIELGFDHVLTSGAAETANLGVQRIQRYVRRAEKRIAVIAAGRVDSRNVQRLITSSGVQQVHASASRRLGLETRNAPFFPGEKRETDCDEVRAIIAAIGSL